MTPARVRASGHKALAAEVMTARRPCTVINRGLHIHPTAPELLPTLLAGLVPMQ
jgi:hypothetical protein